MLLWLAAVALFALGAALTRPRTEVTLDVDGGKVTATVQGYMLRGDFPVIDGRKISVHAARSTFPMGGDWLEVSSDGKPIFQASLPRTFTFRSEVKYPVGDWSVDGMFPEEEVFSAPLDLPSRFTLKGVFYGKSVNGLKLIVDGGNPLVLHFRRGLLNNDASIAVGGQIVPVPTPLRPLEALRDILHMLLRSACLACAAAYLVGHFARLARKLPLPPLPSLSSTRRAQLARALPGLAILVGGAIVTWLAIDVMGNVIHIPDSVAYVIEGRWLARGHTGMALPQTVSTRHFATSPMFAQDNVLHGIYPIGWPLLIAIGHWLFLPEAAVLVLIAMALLALAHLVGRRCYDGPTATIALGLMVLSPVTLLLCASYMAHAACGAAGALATWLVLRATSPGADDKRLATLAGLAAGYAFSVRPMTGLVFCAVLFGFLALELARKRRAQVLPRYAAGAVLGALPAFVYNFIAVGEIGLTAYAKGTLQVGTGWRHFPTGLAHADVNFSYLVSTLFSAGWKVLDDGTIGALALALPMLPFVLGVARREDRLLLALFAALVTSYAFTDAYGVHGFGARFYFEAFFCLFLLAARGLVELASLARRWKLGNAAIRWNAALVAVVVGFLVLDGAVTLPERLSRYRHYNGVDTSLEQAIAARALKRSLILLPGFGWFDWGRAGRRLPASLEDDFVFADALADNAALRAHLSDRPCYRWSNPVLVPCPP